MLFTVVATILYSKCDVRAYRSTILTLNFLILINQYIKLPPKKVLARQVIYCRVIVRALDDDMNFKSSVKEKILQGNIRRLYKTCQPFPLARGRDVTFAGTSTKGPSW